MESARALPALLRATFPGRTTVSPSEVASVIFGLEKAARAAHADAISAAKERSPSLSGLRRSGKIWRLPIGALDTLLDEATEETPKPKRRSKHATIGPRLLLRTERTKEALQAILDAMNSLQADQDARELEEATPHRIRATPRRL